MPGVLQLESLKQAATRLLWESAGEKSYYSFQTIGPVKYGQFVKPGSLLKIFVHLLKKEDQVAHFQGRIDLADGQKQAGRAILADFTLAGAR